MHARIGTIVMGNVSTDRIANIGVLTDPGKREDVQSADTNAGTLRLIKRHISS